MLEYQFDPANIPAILRGFAILGIVACVVAFALTFISGAAAPRKKDGE